MNKAILTIRNAATMHHATRKRLVKWLRDQADRLEREPQGYGEQDQQTFK